MAGVESRFQGISSARQDDLPCKDLGIIYPDAVKGNRLVTCIEILSYANKRQLGFEQYWQKRDPERIRKAGRLMRAGVHLVEIDLIRRSTRSLSDALSLPSPYCISVSRAGKRVEVWAIAMHQALPTTPIPLLSPDADVPLACS